MKFISASFNRIDGGIKQFSLDGFVQTDVSDIILSAPDGIGFELEPNSITSNKLYADFRAILIMETQKTVRDDNNECTTVYDFRFRLITDEILENETMNTDPDITNVYVFWVNRYAYTVEFALAIGQSIIPNETKHTLVIEDGEEADPDEYRVMAAHMVSTQYCTRLDIQSIDKQIDKSVVVDNSSIVGDTVLGIYKTFAESMNHIVRFKISNSSNNHSISIVISGDEDTKSYSSLKYYAKADINSDNEDDFLTARIFNEFATKLNFMMYDDALKNFVDNWDSIVAINLVVESSKSFGNDKSISVDPIVEPSRDEVIKSILDHKMEMAERRVTSPITPIGRISLSDDETKEVDEWITKHLSKEGKI